MSNKKFHFVKETVGEKYGGDETIAFIFEGKKLVGTVTFNGYTMKEEGNDLAMLSFLDKYPSNKYASSYLSTKEDKTLEDTINKTIELIKDNRKKVKRAGIESYGWVSTDFLPEYIPPASPIKIKPINMTLEQHLYYKPFFEQIEELNKKIYDKK